jgi:hypothetical protein
LRTFGIGGENMDNMVLMTCRITKEQKEWLKSKESFNFSGFIREKLKEKIMEEKENANK